MGVLLSIPRGGGFLIRIAAVTAAVLIPGSRERLSGISQVHVKNRKEEKLIQKKKLQKFVVTGSGITVALIAGLLFHTPSGQAQSASDPIQLAKIQMGLTIAPVPLNMTGKDPNLVGYGSYLVNSVTPCNDCHSAGPPTQYKAGGNPFMGQHPKVVNPSTYLGGGRDFGVLGPDPTANLAHIISRNLTPDASGLPEGGNTYDQFVQIMRTGIDFDHAHPNCTGAPDGKCIPAPFVGDLLQIMPWPTLQNMSDSDLQAIYAYLSAIPCLEGGPGEPPNRCGTNAPKTAAVAGPKNATITQNGIQLDGTKSISADGKPLTYAWSIPQGSPSTAISGGATATPTVTFPSTRGNYVFLLTVTDSTGKSSSDTATVYYEGQ